MANKLWVGTDAGNEGNWGTAANWSPSGVPGVGDDVRIPAGSNAITAGLDQSAVALGDVIVESGFSNTIGTSSADLQLDPDRFEFAGTGVSYIDLSAAAISITITDTASAGTGLRGLYLKGSALVTVNVTKGTVGLASIHGTTATITTVRVSGPGADVWIGEGVSLTTAEVYSGKCEQRCASTDSKVYGGTLTTTEVGAITTVTMEGGTAKLHSTGTVTTITGNAGAVDMTGSAASRTVTTLNPQPGFTFTYDPTIVTVTNYNEPGKPSRVQYLGV